MDTGVIRATGIIRAGVIRVTGLTWDLGVLRATGIIRATGLILATGLNLALGVLRATGLIRVVVLTGDARIQRIPEVFVEGELLLILLQLVRQVLPLLVVRSEFSQCLFILLYLLVKVNQPGFYAVHFITSSFSLLELWRRMQACQSSFFISELKGAGPIIIGLGSHGIRWRNYRTRGDGDGSDRRE
ncbi:hypothetical protein FRC0049_02067 [Corynebacterium diphtheriae]|nr:hypothetical protein FRC0049_02067 [Corynebacterium diphtheriae]